MGLSYYVIIRMLFTLRDRLTALRNTKNDALVRYFQNTRLSLDDDGEAIIPVVRLIMQATGLPRHKVSTGIKDLYLNVIHSTFAKPIIVKDCVVTVIISIPWREFGNLKNKEYVDEQKQRSISVVMKIPIIPRLGEHIWLDFICDDLSWRSGYVYDIRHEFDGQRQRVTVFAHPYDNYYYEWARLKADHELERRLERAR